VAFASPGRQAANRREKPISGGLLDDFRPFSHFSKSVDLELSLLRTILDWKLGPSSLEQSGRCSALSLVIKRAATSRFVGYTPKER
jgi:hypothetical protein